MQNSLSGSVWFISLSVISAFFYYIKGDLRPKHGRFGVLISFHEVMKLQSVKVNISDVYPQMCKTFHLWFLLLVFVNFMEKEPSTEFCGVFYHFSRTYEVTNFSVTEMSQLN